MNKMKRSVNKRKGLSTFQIIIMGFAGVILFGTLLLMLPIASKSGNVTPFNEALFTSTSAVCVTGLVVHDTATYWSAFGQAVILVLIQIGGLGVITVVASVTMLAGKRISLMQRGTMQEAIAAPDVGGISKLTVFVIKSTFIFEAVGVIMMLPTFCIEYGWKGIWMAFFHSISAFCNAGFDLMGTLGAQYQSLTAFNQNIIINIAIMFLIITGGIGFLTWEDIYKHKHHIRRYRMQSKVILVTSAVLIVVPTIFFFFVDFAGMPFQQRILSSLFQAVTPRTAGFNTVDFNSMSEGSRGLMMILMLIGGSPGSTAGGMKTTTIAVLIINAIAVFRRKNDAEVFGRRLETGVAQNAATILVMYLTLFVGGAIALSMIESLPFEVCLFETASAVGTVGLTLGITPSLGLASQIILVFLMFLGRVGGLTLIYATMSNPINRMSKLPQEKITVG